MIERRTLEVPVKGMDCADCTVHVREALSALQGVESVEVFLSSEKAVVRLDPAQVDLAAIARAVEGAGYSVPVSITAAQTPPISPATEFTRKVLTLFGVVFGAVVFFAVVGEWLGLFEVVTKRVPWPIWLGVVLVGGYPVFRNVLRASLRGQVISHTLMTLGVVAAVAVGQWATAAVVIFFMRVGDYAERFTTERARGALKNLSALAPQVARVERSGEESEVPIAEVRVGDTVVVRPGEKVPVDGEVTSGQATIDQAAITGESMPIEVGPGSKVFAATIARLGSVRVRTAHVGPDTTFGRVIKLVEEAEAHRASVQRIADKFSAYYLPVVAGIAALTFLIRQDPLATAAVLVVACSCSFALATPIAMLASVGAGAKRGLLIKGGKYLEALARADVLLIDKTGTLTLGRPQVTEIVSLNGVPEPEVLRLAAAAERYSEHPLAQAVRDLARERSIAPSDVEDFVAVPGLGVRARVDGHLIEVGSQRIVRGVKDGGSYGAAAELERQGKTVLHVTRDGEPIGVVGASDTLRADVPEALREARALGIRKIELLTGDNELVAAALARSLDVDYRANLLPEDKIAIVRKYQAEGHTVVMVGDGVNDAPALAQADVGIAMGAVGTDVAMEAAHVVLLREDWRLVPDVLRIARRTLRVVKMNIAFTALYNVVGLSLAALGFLPPILAAAAQSLPDIGILANSSRLLRQK